MKATIFSLRVPKPVKDWVVLRLFHVQLCVLRALALAKQTEDLVAKLFQARTTIEL